MRRTINPTPSSTVPALSRIFPSVRIGVYWSSCTSRGGFHLLDSGDKMIPAPHW